MAYNKLKMNNSKTEVIIYGTSQQLQKTNIDHLHVGGVKVECVTSVRDLGVWMQNNLSFETHIKKKCQIARHQLHNIKSIRAYLSQSDTETLVHGLVNSHLDFCNGLFSNAPQYLINKFQKIQNRAARIIVNAPYDMSAIPIMKQLHWLPVQSRIKFKILVIVFKCLHGTAPAYLKDLIIVKSASCYSLRSSGSKTLVVPRTATKLCDRSFRVVGPRWWNALPSDLKSIDKESVFRRQLKTHLFRLNYGH